MSDQLKIILPDWDVPQHIRAMTTTRHGGVSLPPFKSLNLADHVGDMKDSVLMNRSILQRKWFLPSEPYWLNQTHSTDAIELTDKTSGRNADAAWTTQPEQICTVMTADCLPILIYQEEPESIAAIHAGWRGLLDGVIESTVNALPESRKGIKAWLGPAIGPSAFEVGEEVKQAFVAFDPAHEMCFHPSKNKDKYMADLYHLAKLRLQKIGVSEISGGDYCTFHQDELFYSYRRDGETGRMATLIWISE